MGSNWSSLEREPSPDPWWPKPQSSQHQQTQDASEEVALEEPMRESRGKIKQDELEIFKQELAKKRALRHEALAALQNELRDLRNQVEEEKKMRLEAEKERDNYKERLETRKVCEEEIKVEVGKQVEAEKIVEKVKSYEVDSLTKQLEEGREENRKLAERVEQLEEVNEEKAGLERQVQALKDVSQIGKEMLRIRELQVKELKKKLVELNMSQVMAPPEDLRVEYEKQIENIRKLRTLYEERAAATLVEHQRALEREEAKITVLETKLSDLQKETEEVKELKKDLEGKIEKLENTIQHKENELETTKDDLMSSTVQNKSLNSQMALINNLFSQMLVSPKVDLDRLIRLLKDNHGLISDLTMKGDSNEVAALLVDLAEQVEKEEKLKTNEAHLELKETDSNEDGTNCQVDGANIEKEISANLSKVWRVMVELLSHHQSPTHTELSGGAESCYKCIQTPSGPRSVISVSQTFLTLKDLILEKNKLVVEVGRLKTLNNHLEHRLGCQEKRLSVVTTELRKTWGVVNKLKAQHKQLHTHEKILRYELQQKRCMLTELKQELEHCKDKWERARQKNSETEEDWKKLRKEFAARKSRKESNSAESGYEEDDPAQSPPSEPVNETDLYKLKPKGTEPEASDDEIEHSDGNSFDTVIDLLDISYVENHPENNPNIPLTLDVQPDFAEVSPTLLPLTGSEFTEGLDQIESPDLASVLDIQYQNQILGADYNLSLPSSGRSSPVPTENDDFASSEMEISEEDSTSQDNSCPILTQPQTTSNSVPEDMLLFGSNSSKNISKFLDGLFVENKPDQNKSETSVKLHISVPSTSHLPEESVTPLVTNGSCEKGLTENATPLIHIQEFEFPKRIHEVNATETNPHVVPNENSQEENLKAREDRLKKLEKQCRSLVSKVTSTTFSTDLISNKIISAEDTNSELLERNSPTTQPSLPPTSPKKCEENQDDHTTSLKSSSSTETRTPEQVLEARAARLKRLEEQCKSLFSKMSATSSRSDLISNKLDELHESYGSPEQSTRSSTSSLSHQEISLRGEETENTKYSPESTNSPKSSKKLKDSKAPDLASESKELLNKCSLPGPSMQPILIKSADYKHSRTPEQILEARAERLKRLEEQCKSLVSKMTATSLRSEIIANKLDELHSCYGSSEDVSENEEQSSTASEGSKKSTPVSSPRHARKMARLAEKDKLRESLLKQEHSFEQNENRQEDTVVPASTSTEITPDVEERSKKTHEEILKARDERLKRMEDQCKSLFSKMATTSQRSEEISTKLEDLHQQYGQSTSRHSSELIESSFEEEIPTNLIQEIIRPENHVEIPDTNAESLVNSVSLPTENEDVSSTREHTDTAHPRAL